MVIQEALLVAVQLQPTVVVIATVPVVAVAAKLCEVGDTE
jgi:hypothetical protein